MKQDKESNTSKVRKGVAKVIVGHVIKVVLTTFSPLGAGLSFVFSKFLNKRIDDMDIDEPSERSDESD